MKALHLLPVAIAATASLLSAQGIRPEVRLSTNFLPADTFLAFQIASPAQSLPAGAGLDATARVAYACWMDSDANGNQVLRFVKSNDGGYSWDLNIAQDIWVADTANGESFDAAGLTMKSDGHHVFVVLTADRDALGVPNAGNDDSCWILGSDDQGANWQALNASPGLVNPLPNGVDFNDIDDCRLAVDGLGRAHVCYEVDYDDTGAGATSANEDVYYQRFEFVAGVLTASFPNEVQIETTASGATDTDQPFIAADGDVVVVCWHDARDNGNGDSDDTRSRVSTDGGANWGVDYNHTNFVGDQGEDEPQAVVKGSTIIVCQEDTRGAGNVDEIWCSISFDMGANWTDNILLSQGPSTVDVDQYDVQFMDANTILVAYSDDREGTGNVDNDVYYVVDRNGGADFIAGTDVEFKLTDGAGNADNDTMQEIASNGNVWAISYEDSSFPEGAAVAVSTDFGASWVHYEVAANFAADVDEALVSITANGDVNVIWHDDDNLGNASNVVYTRGVKDAQLTDATATGGGIRYAGGKAAANELVILLPSATAPISNGTVVSGALDGVAYNFTLDPLSVGAFDNLGAFLRVTDVDGNATWAFPNFAQLIGLPIWYFAANTDGMPAQLERQFTDPIRQN